MTGGGGAGARRRVAAAVAGLGALVVAQSAVRAVHQSITHDEACTYNWFVARPSNVFNYDPNNHVAFTYLAIASTRLFGASEWSLRAPTVAAAALYALAVAALLRRAMPSARWALATAALLFANPLVLDYLTAARGYGLALACLMWAFVHALAALEAPAAGPEARRRWGWASLCLGACVACSLASAPAAAGLAGAAVALAAVRSRSLRTAIPARAALPGALVCAAAYLPLAVKVAVAKLASSAPAVAARLAERGWFAAVPDGAPRPVPALVIAVSAALAAALAAAAAGGLAVLRRLAPRARRRLAAATAVLAVVAAAAVAPAATRFGRHVSTQYLYVGHADAASAAEDLADASLARWRAAAPDAPPTARLPAAPLGAALAAVAVALPLAVTLPLLRRTRRIGAPLAPAELAACLFAGTVAAAVALYAVAHAALGVHYPPARAAVYAPPLASAALAFALRVAPRRPRALTAVAAVLALGLLAQYARQWEAESFWETDFDANSRAGFEHLVAAARARGAGAARLGGSWLLEPSMTFYRAVRREGSLAPYQRVEAPGSSALDLIVCRAGSAPDPAAGGWRLLYRDPVGGTTFMARAPRGGG